MSVQVFDDFGPLDERIQVIYQGIDRFVVLSNVDFVDESWTVYVALADKGRWWRATWRVKEVERIAGHDANSSLRKGLAENLARALENGSLHIRGWPSHGNSNENNGNLELLFMQENSSSSSKTESIALELTEISAEEGARVSADAFFNLGVGAQKRGCMLNPPAVSFIPQVDMGKRRRSRSRSTSPPPISRQPRSRSPEQIAKSQREKATVIPAPSGLEKKTVAQTTKHKPKLVKKARKVEKMEFASDED